MGLIARLVNLIPQTGQRPMSGVSIAPETGADVEFCIVATILLVSLVIVI
jgi:hypothetical protein